MMVLKPFIKPVASPIPCLRPVPIASKPSRILLVRPKIRFKDCMMITSWIPTTVSMIVDIESTMISKI